MLKLLLAAGADLHAKDITGATALHRAAGYGRVDAAAFLIARGVDPDAPDKEGRTPVPYAEHRNHPETADFLRDHGAKEPRDGRN